MRKAHAKAHRKLEAVRLYRVLDAFGLKRGAAMDIVTRRAGISAATMYRVLNAIRVAPEEMWFWLLLPSWVGRTKRADFSQAAWEALKAEYLMQRRPRLTRGLLRKIRAAARVAGWSVPSRRTVQRRITRELGRFARRSDQA